VAVVVWRVADVVLGVLGEQQDARSSNKLYRQTVPPPLALRQPVNSKLLSKYEIPRSRSRSEGRIAIAAIASHSLMIVESLLACCEIFFVFSFTEMFVFWFLFLMKLRSGCFVLGTRTSDAANHVHNVATFPHATP
jgi:hypothetical protein